MQMFFAYRHIVIPDHHLVAWWDTTLCNDSVVLLVISVYNMGSFELNTCFFKMSIFCCCILKCPLHIASYTMRIGVSVMEL